MREIFKLASCILGNNNCIILIDVLKIQRGAKIWEQAFVNKHKDTH